ncbi:MAG TPA: hypothetical protein VLX85_00770 [Stellaceae bacterium]|nr:hypothetical protein [Stellaceae bacterium]
MQPPSMLDGVSTYVPTPENVAATTTAARTNTHAWKDGGSFGFHDLLDTINPLQHIPVVSTIYRWLTGDTPGNVAEVVGDGIYGGPVGVGIGFMSIAFKEETGEGPGEMAMAKIAGPDSGATKVAAAGATAMPPPATPSMPPPASPRAAAASAPANLPTPPVVGIPVTSVMGAPLPPSRPATPAVASTSGAATTPEQAFLNQKAAIQRGLYGPRPAVPDHPVTRPIPLHLSGPVLRATSPRPILIPASGVQPKAASAPVAISAPATLPSAALPADAPVDISQRMMDALDKYARLQQDRQRGQQLDLTP